MVISFRRILFTDSRRCLIHYTQFKLAHTETQQKHRSLTMDHLVYLSLRLWLHHLVEFDPWP
jgi:hypothetical protein